MVSKTVPRPANRCSRRSSRRNRSSRLAASFLAVSIAQIAPAAAQLEASRRPCVGASKPTPATGAHLQLSWDSCDYAQNPLDPYWIDPNTAPGARPARRSLAPGTTGKECDSFPFVHGELHPVYGLALRGRDPPGPGQDRWAFFARNSGTEGFCSDGRQIDLGLEYLALVLSAPSNPAAGYEIVAADVRRHPTDARVGWTIFPVQEGAVVLVRFPRGDPTYQFLEGEVTLRWK